MHRAMAMVHVEEIRKARRAQPFRPFTIHLADGRSFPVKHPEIMWLTSDGRTLVVEDTDGLIEILSGMLVTGLTVEPPPEA